MSMHAVPKVRALAITSPQRFGGLPGTPTLAESGLPGYAPQPWIGQLPAFKNEKKRENAYTWFGPVLAGERLWLTNSRGQLVAVSPADGSQQMTIEAGNAFSLPPIVANKTLYVLDDKGQLSAYR